MGDDSRYQMSEDRRFGGWNRAATVVMIGLVVASLAVAGVAVSGPLVGQSVAQTQEPATIAAGSTSTSPGASASVDLTLSTAPEGVSGYDLVVRLADPSVGTITSASVASEFGLDRVSVSDDGTTVMLAGVDNDENVQPGATDVQLGTVELTGESAGTTQVVVEEVNLDDDDGNAANPGTTPGTLTVAGAGTDTPTGTATATETRTATETATPTATDTPTSTETTATTDTATTSTTTETATATETATETTTPTDTEQPTGTETAGPTATPTDTTTPTSTAESTTAETETATETETPTGTDTSARTATTEPTDTAGETTAAETEAKTDESGTETTSEGGSGGAETSDGAADDDATDGSLDERAVAESLAGSSLSDGQVEGVSAALSASGLTDDRTTAITDALAGDGLSDEQRGAIADTIADGDLSDQQFVALSEALADGSLTTAERDALGFLGSDGATYYQIDLVRGEPIEQLRGPNGTYTNDQLVRFAHGSSEEPITRRSVGEFTTDAALAERIESRNITVENGTASTTFTVAEGESVTLSLVSYTKPGPVWSPATEHLQEYVDGETRTFESGTHTLRVDLPQNATDEER
ncbi:hypothetical protein [Halococcus sediminicola]|uniref:hypothetical protein n=1 Tax=Halococcus sediminicola TaxID=1264579 RepID=UPI000A59F160|nr:hypothetical protein [Halococcus sediminicola]